jgi:multiple sugar transport system permease protein
MIMPGTALVLPVFLELNAVHLVSSAFAVILPFSFFPFGVYLSYIYFDTTLPANVLSAASVDGCSAWQTFRYVALPMARPVIALVAFFSFVADWNNFFLPFIMLPQSGRYPIQVGLTNLLASTPAFTPGQGGTDVVSRPEDAIAILLSAAPILLVFLFAQRFLTSGLLAGAVKE